MVFELLKCATSIYFVLPTILKKNKFNNFVYKRMFEAINQFKIFTKP